MQTLKHSITSTIPSPRTYNNRTRTAHMSMTLPQLKGAITPLSEYSESPSPVPGYGGFTAREKEYEPVE
jgi:hypothetical protein